MVLSEKRLPRDRHSSTRTHAQAWKLTTGSVKTYLNRETYRTYPLICLSPPPYSAGLHFKPNGDRDQMHCSRLSNKKQSEMMKDGNVFT